ncbi:DedA family protein [Sphingobacterium rhinopitheci]|uniref:DedA family protein n=1 Tax=Sphingobacterium rhinopitheci TaxID=2781960 RepID=UPI001F52AE59|nr:DedA family protein [Sphingobacterium rhinopitheci]MCI0921874.1 DedA family protein [Sphingobacterium rhinopitheci]
MEWITQLIDFILHIDIHLVQIVNEYHYWTYLLLFLIIFAETGLVVTPFLPGDSVLFAMGALIAKPETDIYFFLMFFVLIIAAVIGDFVNYEVGKYLGIRVFKKDAMIFKLSYLHKTQAFYAKHGNKTIIYARFVPIIRTFAPFFAGISKMKYPQFVKYNVIGGVLWVSIFLSAGYLFGQIAFIRDHFSLVVLAIIALSLIPFLFELFFGKK